MEEIARGWKAYLLLAVSALAVIGFYSLQQANQRVAGTDTTATIIAFGGGGTAQVFQPGQLRVTVESDDGSVGAAIVDGELLEGCEIGDRIPAVAKGINIEPRPRPCV